jgi:hypothetical protein
MSVLPNTPLLLNQCLVTFCGALCTWVPLNLTAKVLTLVRQGQISQTPMPGRDSKYSCPV